MIFYYSGTGNSAYAAQQLCAQGEALLSITQTFWDGQTTFELKEGEAVGFVFPVYFGGLPNTVRQLLARLRFNGTPGYVFAAVTCGPAGVASLLKKTLAKNGTPLHAVFSVRMPANYAVLYDVTSEEKEVPILQKADETLAEVKRSIADRAEVGTDPGIAARCQTAVLYPLYDSMRKTAKFHVNEQCVSCGACAGRCPAHAIELRDGVPTWIVDRCDHCMSCVRCGAIEYGDRLTGKYRYKHPSLRKKASGHDHQADHSLG